MNRINFKKQGQIINLKELIWDLLQQWKAVLIVALIMMLLVSGLKYYKDIRSYESNKAAEGATEQTGSSMEQRIETVLESLPEDERMTVEYMVKQEEWMSAEKEYINNSILMNTNPANQRTLVLDYLISAPDASDSRIMSILTGYASALAGEKIVEKLRPVIAPDAESKYITELVKTNISNNAVNEGKAQFVTSDEDAAVMSVYIVMPDGVDAAAVEAAVTAALKDNSPGLSSKIGPHSIELLQSEESYLFNADAVYSRNNVLYSIFNLTNNTKNMKTSLSESQKAALESISSIKKEIQNAGEVTESSTQEPQKPGFSKKYALVGFMLGAFAYAFIYLILVMLKGCVSCSSDVENYTQNRLLGEVYEDSKPKGAMKLFHSKLVEKVRYRGKSDPEHQIKRAVDAVAAVCERVKAKKLTMFNTTGGLGASAKAIIEGIKSCGVEVEIIDTSSEIEEKRLLDVDNSVIITGPSTKVALLSDLVSHCAEYDVKLLGSVYSAR